MTDGWTAPKGTVPTPEDLRDHMDTIRNTDEYVIPASIADEMAALAKLMK